MRHEYRSAHIYELCLVADVGRTALPEPDVSIECCLLVARDNRDVLSLLTGEAPAFRSGVNPEAVRQDGAGPLAASMLTRIDEAPHEMLLLTAPRGLQNQAQPMMPLDAVNAKVAANDNLQFAEIADCNHYTIVMGGGAPEVARRLEAFLG